MKMEKSLNCVALTWKEIGERYGCSRPTALNIIRTIRACCGGGKLPVGKVLPSEVEYWESIEAVEKKKVRV